VMIDIPDGNNLTFLPLDQLLSGSRSSANSLQGSGLSGVDSGSLVNEFNNNASRNRSRETRE